VGVAKLKLCPSCVIKATGSCARIPPPSPDAMRTVACKDESAAGSRIPAGAAAQRYWRPACKRCPPPTLAAELPSRASPALEEPPSLRKRTHSQTGTAGYLLPPQAQFRSPCPGQGWKQVCHPSIDSTLILLGIRRSKGCPHDVFDLNSNCDLAEIGMQLCILKTRQSVGG